MTIEAEFMCWMYAFTITCKKDYRSTRSREYTIALVEEELKNKRLGSERLRMARTYLHLPFWETWSYIGSSTVDSLLFPEAPRNILYSNKDYESFME